MFVFNRRKNFFLSGGRKRKPLPSCGTYNRLDKKKERDSTQQNSKSTTYISSHQHCNRAKPGRGASSFIFSNGRYWTKIRRNVMMVMIFSPRFYYLSKKRENYKQLLRKPRQRRTARGNPPRPAPEPELPAGVVTRLQRSQGEWSTLSFYSYLSRPCLLVSCNLYLVFRSVDATRFEIKFKRSSLFFIQSTTGLEKPLLKTLSYYYYV